MHSFLRKIWVIVLGFIYLVAFFFALEIYCRFRLQYTDKHNMFVLGERRKAAAFSEAFEDSLWESIWDKYKKNVEVRQDIDGTFFQIKMNSLGFRANEIRLPKPQGVFRVVCIGGSTTVEGPTNDTTYPALLEKKLNRDFSNRRIEVFNCGISSLTALGEKERMPLYLKLEPDMIIEYNFVNDFARTLIPQWWVSRRPWKIFLMRSLFLSEYFADYVFVSKKEVRNSINALIIPNIKEMYEECLRQKVKFVVCGFAAPDTSKISTREREYFDYNIKAFWDGKVNLQHYAEYVKIYNQCLEEFCRKNNIIFIPVQKYLSGGTDYFVDIAHLTPKGIEAKAEAIFQYLKVYLNDRSARQ
ncbi:MAG: GDSL-type esterase/lipase family protein [Candidatus Omnitrophica bacterium]|nr:GDSL-type esterase/lipase family protein [Candidatus Omnitrophota bacterium]